MTNNEMKEIIKAQIMKACDSEYSGSASSKPSWPKLWKELKPKQVRNIEARVGSYFTEETFVLFFDKTLTDSGKEGFLFTTEGIVCIGSGEGGVKGTPPLCLTKLYCGAVQRWQYLRFSGTSSRT